MAGAGKKVPRGPRQDSKTVSRLKSKSISRLKSRGRSHFRFRGPRWREASPPAAITFRHPNKANEVRYTDPQDPAESREGREGMEEPLQRTDPTGKQTSDAESPRLHALFLSWMQEPALFPTGAGPRGVSASGSRFQKESM